MPALAIAIIFVASLLQVPTEAASSPRCDLSEEWSTPCALNTGESIEIGAERTEQSSGGGGSDHDSRSHPGDPIPNPTSTCFNFLCRDSYAAELLPTLTVSDLVSFVPARPALGGEPAGLGVVGMPTNIIATAPTQEIPGRLLDFDVIVQFVPAGYRFDYGDGTQQTTTTGGSSWARLGQADFTPTPTTHVYKARGTYAVTVTALYRAAVDFGNGWRPVTGYVEATTPGYRIRVVEVHTALVDKTCLENPAGPGC